MGEIRTLVWDRAGAAPKSAMGIGSLVVALLIGIAPLLDTGWTWGFVVSAVVLGLLLLVIAIAQDHRDSRLTAELKALRADHLRCRDEIDTAVRHAESAKDTDYTDYIQWLCHDRLAMILHLIAAAFASPTQPERRTKATIARTAILCATVELVGTVEKGTRANIFRLQTGQDGAEEMTPDGFWGRGDQSTRIFRPGMSTFDATKCGQGRFCGQTNRTDPDTGADLPYETYLSYPIREGDGKLYGVFTVDCLREGELREGPDIARMSVLAVMLALTYRAEDVRPAQRTAL